MKLYDFGYMVATWKILIKSKVSISCSPGVAKREVDMYVRWNRRKRTKKIAWVMKEGDYLYAVLVESIRIDGKPRQRTIAYLGGVGENNPGVYGRMRFWEQCERKLASLNLDAAVLEKIVTSLKTRVQKPSQDEFDAWHKARAEELKRYEDRIRAARR